MGMIEAILAALAAIPKILDEISLLRQAIEKNNIAKENVAIAKAIQDIASAHSPDSYQAAAKEINDALKGL